VSSMTALRICPSYVAGQRLGVQHELTAGGAGVGGDCVSACNFDPLSWGIGVQN
jgi:hypothetical protein